MTLLIKGLHIKEIFIDADPEEERAEPEPIREEPKAEPVKAEPKKTESTPMKTNRKTIDKGKVGALYKAGWAITKIAEEMSCSAPTIRKALTELGLIG